MLMKRMSIAGCTGLLKLSIRQYSGLHVYYARQCLYLRMEDWTINRNPTMSV